MINIPSLQPNDTTISMRLILYMWKRRR